MAAKLVLLITLAIFLVLGESYVLFPKDQTLRKNLESGENLNQRVSLESGSSEIFHEIRRLNEERQQRQKNHSHQSHNKIQLVSSGENNDNSMEIHRSQRIHHDTNPMNAGNGLQKTNQVRERDQKQQQSPSDQKDPLNQGVVNQISKIF